MHALQASAAAAARGEGGLRSPCSCGARGRGKGGLCPSCGCGAVREERTDCVRPVPSTFGRLQLCPRGRSHPSLPPPSPPPASGRGHPPPRPPSRRGHPPAPTVVRLRVRSLTTDTARNKSNQESSSVRLPPAYRGTMSRAQKLARATDCCLLLAAVGIARGYVFTYGADRRAHTLLGLSTAGPFKSNSYCVQLM